MIVPFCLVLLYKTKTNGQSISSVFSMGGWDGMGGTEVSRGRLRRMTTGDKYMSLFIISVDNEQTITLTLY